MASELKVDTISEKTTASGVTIDGVLIKDGEVDGVDVSAIISGLAVFDQWQITANKTSAGDITSNWARPTGTLQGGYSTGMTESSGIFSFPETGYYLVSFQADFVIGNNDRFIETMIVSTNDNFSTEDLIARSAEGNNTGSTAGGTANCSVILDVTNIANDKVKFKLDSLSSGSYANGNTLSSQTYATFLKLGDT